MTYPDIHKSVPEYIDIHAHVNFPDFDADRDEVIARAHAAQTWMINVGTDKEASRAAVELARKYDKGVYAIIGLHPTHTDPTKSGETGEVFDYDFYKELASDPKVLAIGECGLDFFRADPSTADTQKKVFEAQIKLAQELGKPLMLHIRGAAAYKEAHHILTQYPGVKGDVHFFAGTPEEARLFLDLGFTLSFTGVITFARDYDEVIRSMPLSMIMSETDCPWVTPTPHRGKRNEPAYVQEVVKKIAEIRGEDLEMVKKALISNAKRVFDGLPDFNTSL